MLSLCSAAPQCYPVLVTPCLSVSSFISLSLAAFSLSYEKNQSLILIVVLLIPYISMHEIYTTRTDKYSYFLKFTTGPLQR